MPQHTNPCIVANHLVKIARPSAETPFPLSSPVDALIAVTYRQRQDKLATETDFWARSKFAVELKVSHVCTSHLTDVFVIISKLSYFFKKEIWLKIKNQKSPKIYNCCLTYFDNFFLTRNQAFVTCRDTLTETLTHGYSSERPQWELSNEYRLWHLDFRLGARKGLLIKIMVKKTGFLVNIHTILGP